MTMGRGTKRIDIATLRRMLPWWFKSLGYVIDDSVFSDTGVMWVDCSVLGNGVDVVKGFLKGFMDSVTIVDGGIWYKSDDRMSTVYIRVDHEE